MNIRSPLCLLLFLTACAAPLQTPFREADFQKSQGRGTATITGRAYGVWKDGSVIESSDDYVDLVPVTAYSTEYVTRHFGNGEKISSPPKAYWNYVRIGHTDAHGNFAIRQVPAGEYYLCGESFWHNRYPGTDNDGTPITLGYTSTQLFYQRLTVRAGANVSVTHWIQAKQPIEPLTAHQVPSD